MRSRWLVLFASAAVAMLALLLLTLALSDSPVAPASTARAARPELVEQAIASTLGFRTAYHAAAGGVVQIDVQRTAITYDYPGARVHWVGAGTEWNTASSRS